MTPEDMDKLIERLSAMASRGASINVSDPRVTSIQTWLLSSIGLALIGLGSWGIKSINELNQTMTRVVTQNEFRDRQVDRIEEHVGTLDGRVLTLEKRAR